MAEDIYITDIVEKTRLEILFAIKVRISELSNGNQAPVQLNDVTVRDGNCPNWESARYFDVNNIFVDDGGCLCGDLASKFGRFPDDLIFGKSIEDLAIDDLKSILDALYKRDVADGKQIIDLEMPVKKAGLSGFFQDRYSSKARNLRKSV